MIKHFFVYFRRGKQRPWWYPLLSCKARNLGESCPYLLLTHNNANMFPWAIWPVRFTTIIYTGRSSIACSVVMPPEGRVGNLKIDLQLSFFRFWKMGTWKLPKILVSLFSKPGRKRGPPYRLLLWECILYMLLMVIAAMSPFLYISAARLDGNYNVPSHRPIGTPICASSFLNL